MRNKFLIVFILSYLFSSCINEVDKPIKTLSISDKFEFKNQTVGTVKQFDVVLENNGDQKIIIDTILTTCGCTAIQPSSLIVEKKNKIIIPVSIKIEEEGEKEVMLKILSDATPKIMTIPITYVGVRQ